MYEVKIINDNIETYINIVSSNINAPRIKGQIKKGINVIDSFQFDITPNNQGYDKLIPLKTLVEVLNIKTQKLEFKGRVLLPKHSMNESGLIIKNILCESELGFLMDSTQRFKKCSNVTIKEFLEIIIDNHNNQVEEYKRFTLGVIELNNDERIDRYLDYEETLPTIKNKIINIVGGEIRIRYENGIRYLDYLTEIGYTSNTEIRLTKNLKSISEEKDVSNIITKLIPLGAQVENPEGTNQETNITERITISSVNNGIDYLENKEAIKEFGIIEKKEVWDNIIEPTELLIEGKKLLINNKIKRKYSIEALDLSLVGIDFDNIDIYNKYKIINPLMKIDDYLRVIEKTIIIEKPEASTINVGDKFDDIKEEQISVKNISNIARKANDKVDTAIVEINSVKNNVSDLNPMLLNIFNQLKLIKTTLELIKIETDKINNIEEKIDIIISK